MNSVVLIGRLTKDPEMHMTQSGVSCVKFTLAVDRPVKREEGKQTADFPQIVAWRQNADVICQYCHKGSQLGITGRLQTRHYTNTQTGNEVYVTEVMADRVDLLGSRTDSESKPKTVSWGRQAPKVADEDDLPF